MQRLGGRGVQREKGRVPVAELVQRLREVYPADRLFTEPARVALVVSWPARPDRSSTQPVRHTVEILDRGYAGVDAR